MARNFPTRIKHLKHDAGVVSKPANDPDINRHKISQGRVRAERMTNLLSSPDFFRRFLEPQRHRRRGRPAFSAVFSRGSRPNLSMACKNSSHRSAGTSSLAQKIGTKFPIADLDDKIFFGESERPQMSMHSATNSISAARSGSPMTSQFN